MTTIFSSFGLDPGSGSPERPTHPETFAGHRWLDFSDEYQPARQIADRFDWIAHRLALREAIFPFAAPFDLTRFTDEDVLLQAAARMTAGRLEATSGFQWRPPQGDAADTGPAEQEEPPEEEPPSEEPPPPATEEETAWIKFKVVDENSGEPVKGVTLHVKTPDGKIRQIRTGPDGMAEIGGIQPGSCSIERIVDSDALEIKAIE